MWQGCLAGAVALFSYFGRRIGCMNGWVSEDVMSDCEVFFLYYWFVVRSDFQINGIVLGSNKNN